MPETLQAGQKSELTLQRGETLSITTDASSTGRVRRLADAFGGANGNLDAIPAGTFRTYGPYPRARKYSVESLSGAVLIDQDVRDIDFATQRGSIEPFTGSRTLSPDDNGKILRCDDASNVTITVPNNLPRGFNVGFAKWAAGNVTIAAASGATNRTSKTVLSTQYQVGSLIVIKQGSNDTMAEFVLGGDFA